MPILAMATASRHVNVSHLFRVYIDYNQSHSDQSGESTKGLKHRCKHFRNFLPITVSK